MAELTSVGLDIGTTTSQMVVSRLSVENRASSFAVPEMEIANREILYRGEVRFTPLLHDTLVDAEALKLWVAQEYQKAGITREMVDTGAVIITGETSRRENARAVMEALAEYAGNFVVATAGPDLESILSAKGAGAVAISRETGQRILHMDIGGGTSNLSLMENGEILATGCLNVGGRLVKLEGETVSYVSPVVSGLTTLKPGDRADAAALDTLADILTQALEEAAGFRPATGLLRQLETREAASPWEPPEGGVKLSFSGGVADCIAGEYPDLAFGDLGPRLGRAIRESRLCRGGYLLGSETIRATVIGAGCYSAQLSGSTVFCRNVEFPMKNLPVLTVKPGNFQSLSGRLQNQDAVPVLALKGISAPSYGQVTALAEELVRQLGQKPLYLCLEQDMAKALGQALALRMGSDVPILCIDRVRVTEGDFLDVGSPIGPALPVVVKTLVLER